MLAGGVLGRYAPRRPRWPGDPGRGHPRPGHRLSLVAVGLTVSGSLAFGLAWAMAGAVFAGVALVAAQLCRTARAARGLAAAS